MNKTALLLLAAITAAAVFSAVPVFAMRAAMITYNIGDTFIGDAKNGPWEKIEKGMQVPEGKFLKTGKKGVIELTLPDNSVVRLAPGTLYKLDEMVFGEKGPRRFSARLFIGRLWAKINKKMGRDRNRFNTRTPTSVIGVRGTVFSVKTDIDSSTYILVYKGRVGVAPPLISEEGPREEIAWPQEVSEKKWEEIILGQLQKLHIDASGKPGAPESFDPEKEKDDWTAWNRKRDAAH